MRRWRADSSANRSATATASGCTSRTHACRHLRGGWRWLWRLSGRELLAHRRRRCGRSYFVITTATTEVDEIRIVGVLQDSQKIPLAETLALTTEQLAVH